MGKTLAALWLPLFAFTGCYSFGCSTSSTEQPILCSGEAVGYLWISSPPKLIVEGLSTHKVLNSGVSQLRQLFQCRRQQAGQTGPTGKQLSLQVPKCPEHHHSSSCAGAGSLGQPGDTTRATLCSAVDSVLTNKS